MLKATQTQLHTPQVSQAGGETPSHAQQVLLNGEGVLLCIMKSDNR